MVLESRGAWGGLCLSRLCRPVASRPFHVGSSPRRFPPELQFPTQGGGPGDTVCRRCR